MKNTIKITLGFIAIALTFSSCNNSKTSESKGGLSSSAAEQVYVKPGDHD